MANKHTLVVITNPTPGKEAEYNKWYSDTHLADVLKVKGFVAAQRFKVSLADPAKPLVGPYLALYEYEGDDIPAAMAALGEAAQSGAMVMTDALDLTNISTSMFTPITPRVTR